MKSLKEMMENIGTDLNEENWITLKGAKITLFKPQDIKGVKEKINDAILGGWDGDGVLAALNSFANNRMSYHDEEPKDEEEVEKKITKIYKKWEKGVNKLTKELLADAKKITYEEWTGEVDADTGEPRY